MDTEKVEDYGLLFLRVGFFITIIFSVFTKIQNPNRLANVFQKSRGLSIIGTPTGVYIVAVLLTIFALMILLGFYSKIAGIAFTIFFIGTIITTIGTPIFNNVNVWKDFALLGTSIYFMTNGTGKYSIIKLNKK